jgi:peptide chain release factor 3
VSDSDQAPQKFISLNRSTMAEDKNGDPVFLVRNDWSLNRAIEESPELKFLKVRERS